MIADAFDRAYRDTHFFLWVLPQWTIPSSWEVTQWVVHSTFYRTNSRIRICFEIRFTGRCCILSHPPPFRREIGLEGTGGGIALTHNHSESLRINRNHPTHLFHEPTQWPTATSISKKKLFENPLSASLGGRGVKFAGWMKRCGSCCHSILQFEFVSVSKTNIIFQCALHHGCLSCCVSFPSPLTLCKQ